MLPTILFVKGSKVSPLPAVKPVTPVMASKGVESRPIKETSAVVPAMITMTLVAEGDAELPIPETDALAVALPVEERPPRERLPEEALLRGPADVDSIAEEGLAPDAELPVPDTDAAEERSPREELPETLPAGPAEVDPVPEAGLVGDPELPVPETEARLLREGFPEEALPERPAEVDPVADAGLVTDPELPDAAARVVDAAEEPAVPLRALDEDVGAPITRVIVVVYVWPVTGESARTDSVTTPRKPAGIVPVIVPSVALNMRPVGRPVTLRIVSVVPLRTLLTSTTMGSPAATATTAAVEAVGLPELAVLEKEADTFRAGTVTEEMDDDKLAEAEADSKADDDRLADSRADDKLAEAEAEADSKAELADSNADDKLAEAEAEADSKADDDKLADSRADDKLAD